MLKHKIKHRWMGKGLNSNAPYKYGLTVKGATREVILFQTKEDRDWLYDRCCERTGDNNVEDYIKLPK